MRKSLLPAALTSLVLCFAVARLQADPGAGSANFKELTPAQMQADFDLMRHALEEAHPGLYRYTTKPQIDGGFAAGRAKLIRPMNQMQFLMVLSETVALIHCGHTEVVPDEGMAKVLADIPMLPLRVHAEKAGLMIQFNDTPDDQSIRPGMQLLAINGHKVEDVPKRIWPLESADGDIETGKRMHLPNNFPIYYWALVEHADKFTVEARDETGRIVKPTLAGVRRADRQKNQNPVNAPARAAIAKWNWSSENLALRFLKDPDIAEIRMRYFVGDDYPQRIEQIFQTLKAKGTKSLIIDLRGNGGGEDMYGAMLVSYLTNKPFRYFDHINIKTINPSFKDQMQWNPTLEERLRDGTTPNPAGGYLVTAALHPGVAEQAPRKYPFMGKVFVLIDGGTFSTAADFCAVTHHLKRATFIGEETGGGYYGNNSGLSARLTLPNSKLAVRLQMYEYWNAVPGYPGKRRGTIPDRAVEMKVADLLRGVDAPLDLAQKLAAGGLDQSGSLRQNIEH